MTDAVVSDIRPLAAVAVSAIAVVCIIASHRYPNVREGWSVLAALTKFGIVVSMLPDVLSGTVYEWRFDSFVLNVDFALRADPLGLYFALLASFLWIFTAFYGAGYMRGLNEHGQTRFFAAFAASLSAAVGIAFAENLLTIFIFYELLSLVTYPLVAHNEDREARIAGRKYLAYTFFGGGVFLLAGTVLVYWLTARVGDPTLSFESGGMSAMSTVAGMDPTFVHLSFFLLIAGFAVKAAVMPLHSWLADAMVAPTPVSGLLHAVAVVKSGAFGVARVILDVFGVDLLSDLHFSVGVVGTSLDISVPITLPVAVMAAFTLVAASVIALRKDNLKRRLAFSTTAQLSYIVLGLSLLHPITIFGALFHIATHAFGKLTLFFCAGAIHVETHVDYISDMAGIGKRMPLTMAAFTIGAAGMAGIPLVGGFVSKFYLMVGSVEAGHWPFALALVISGILNIAYFWPIVYTAFFESVDRHDEKPIFEYEAGGRPVSSVSGSADVPRADGGSPADNVDSFGTEPSFQSDESAVDSGDEDEHDHGPPADGWEFHTAREESSWLMLMPIAVIATGAIVLGIVPGLAIFFDLADVIVETVTGEVILE